MVTIRELEMAEELFDFEPSASYPARAVAMITQLTGASAHRLVVEGSEVSRSTPPQRFDAHDERDEVIAIPLYDGTRQLGELQLWLRERSEDAYRVARWAGRILSRGLSYGRKLDTLPPPGGNREVDIQALLASTPLTPRERDVVGRLVAGHSTREIATSTGLTVATVNTYLKRIFAKLGVHSRVELLARVTGTRNAFPMAQSNGLASALS